MIPGTADAASVTLRVNLECLSAHSALDGFVMNPELSGGWKPVSLDHFLFFSFLFFKSQHSRRRFDSGQHLVGTDFHIHRDGHSMLATSSSTVVFSLKWMFSLG